MKFVFEMKMKLMKINEIENRSKHTMCVEIILINKFKDK